MSVKLNVTQCHHCQREMQIATSKHAMDMPFDVTCSFGHTFTVQYQDCEFCEKETLIQHPLAFTEGIYTCGVCHAKNKINPWVRPKKASQKGPLWWTLFKDLFKSKKDLIRDPALACDKCQTDTIFWKIGGGAVKVCALCGEEDA